MNLAFVAVRNRERYPKDGAVRSFRQQYIVKNPLESIVEIRGCLLIMAIR